MHNKKALLSSSQIITFLCFLFLCPSLVHSQVGTVTLRVGYGFGEPGSTNNPVAVSLDNQGDSAAGIQFDLCDLPDDNLFCTDCYITERTVLFDCVLVELPDGCCRVIMFCTNPGCFIGIGSGSIVSVRYNVSADAPVGGCQDQILDNVIVVDSDGFGLTVNLEDGQFCFLVDSDDDGVPDDGDNSGTVGDNPCTGGQTVGCDDNCLRNSNPNQEDTHPPQGNGTGDACDCEANFDCDTDVDANDVETFLANFGRFPPVNPCTNADPCNGDFICDGDVDGDDVEKFLEDFGRFQFNNPCPACEVGDWCAY